MKKRAVKSLLSIVMALCILFTMAPVFAVEPDPFSDVPTSHWAYQSIMNIVRLGVISGYPDGTFKPDQLVSREEFAKMLCGATSIPLVSPNTNTFADVPTDHWAFRYVETVKDFLTGYPSANGGKSLFKGTQDATREDIAVALVKIKGFNETTLPNPNIINDMYKDPQSISSNLKNLVAVAVEKKLIAGYPDQTIRGQQSLTRAEAATIIDRANSIAGDIKGVTNPSAQIVYLTVDCSKTTGKVGETLQASAKGVYSTGQTRDVTNEVTWSSSDSNILTVSNGGEIYLKKAGSASITATIDGKADSQEILVFSQSQADSDEIKFIKVLPESKAININDIFHMRAEAVYDNGKVVDITSKVKWDSSNENIAIVSSEGKVVGIKEGVALIKAGFKSYTGYGALSVTESVYNPPSDSTGIALEGITISHTYKELKIGSKANIKALGTYTDRSKKDITSTVSWSSDNQAVATVDENGRITALTEGVVKITATKDGKSCSMYVVVKKR